MYGPVAFSDGAAVFFRYFKLPITCAKMLEVPVIIKIVLNLLSIESNCTHNNNLFASCTNASTRQYSFGNITQQTACIMEYITSQKDGIILKYKSFSFQKELETTEKIIWGCLEYTIKKMP
ncbi:hypothetical protein QTP88_010882 [Uroleucon formosanum]